MDILGFFSGLITNNIVVMGVSAAIGATAWKIGNVAWSKFRPLDLFTTQFAIRWASEKGESFGRYYAGKLKNKEFIENTVNDLDRASDQIRDAFIAGVRKGAGL